MSAEDQLFTILDADEKVTKSYSYVGITKFLQSKYYIGWISRF